MKITGLHLVHLTSVNSTQLHLKQLLEAGCPEEGTLVLADVQSRGRGQAGNVWESEAKQNLLLSFVRYPDFLHAENFFLLNKYVALAVCDTVQILLPDRPVRIKWPNDIYVGDRKIAGILIENSLIGEYFRYSVTGIGLNVNQTGFSAGLPNPVSLKMLTGRTHDLQEILDLLCTKLDRRYDQMLRPSVLIRDFHARLYRRQQYAQYLYEGRHIEAKITGVSQQGMLQLKIKRGRRIECAMKEIAFVISPESDTV